MLITGAPVIQGQDPNLVITVHADVLADAIIRHNVAGRFLYLSLCSPEWFRSKVSRLEICKMIVLMYYVKNKEIKHYLRHEYKVYFSMVISQGVINTETRLTFQFLVIFSAEFRYSFIFWPIYLENTFSFFRPISINTAVVIEQTTEAFDWKLIGFI